MSEFDLIEYPVRAYRVKAGDWLDGKKVTEVDFIDDEVLIRVQTETSFRSYRYDRVLRIKRYRRYARVEEGDYFCKCPTPLDPTPYDGCKKCGKPLEKFLSPALKERLREKGYRVE